MADLLGRLSLAFDISCISPHGKAVRCVVLALELGVRAGVAEEALHDTYWVSLLGYLGCGAPDMSMRLAEMVGAAPRVRNALTDLCEPRQAMGLPARLSRMGRMMEMAHQQHGREGAVAFLQRGAGGEIDSRLTKVFIKEQAALFTAIEDPRIFDRFLALEPGPVVCADDHRVDDVARALATFADLRCPIFVGHSTSVAALAERAAAELGFAAEDVRVLRRAALLHDIGRLGVPNRIWTKPGPLDWSEMERVRLHAYYTTRVLSPIRLLGPVADVAAAAHERVDGAGYPQARITRSLSPAARVLAVADMAVAMSEARPHREALGPEHIARELVAEVDAGRLDAWAVDAVMASLGVKTRLAARRTHGLSDRELEVCGLIARGKMNKEIGDVLGITLRTVQNHVAHIFDKLGVHSRSGVAVWLVENDLAH